MKNKANSVFFAFNTNIQKAIFAGLLFCTGVFASAQSPTAPAQGFNVFLRNGAALTSNQTEGPVAAGGDFTLSGNYRIATNSAGTFKVNNVPIGLLIGGKVVFSSGNENYVQNGYVKIGNSANAYVYYKDNNGANANIRITDGGYGSKPNIQLQSSASNLGVSETTNPVFESGLIDFALAFTTMQTSARNISGYATNIELTNPNGNIKGNTIPSVLTNGQLKVNLKEGINVLNTTGVELNSVTGNITFNTKPSASRILVINVNAPNTYIWKVWNQSGIGLQESPYIIYNFYNTKNLNIQGYNTIEGTVFAPFADIVKTQNTANIDGQVIGLSYYQTGGDNRYANFIPTLLPNVIAPTTGASNLVFADAALNSIKLSWTNGNGDSRIVIAQNRSEAALPVNNQVYQANASFGKGSGIGSGYVVYTGSGNSVTVTSLEPNTLYYFTVIEYNAKNSTIVYNTSLKLVSSATTLADTDNDGVGDVDDNYPNDASKAFNNPYPSNSFSTLMFEDLWPFKGDYDFNDLVLDFSINTITNAANNVAEVEYSFIPRAVGSANKNGFAFQLDHIHPDKIVSVSGTKMSAGWSKLNSNGTEEGHPLYANIIVFDDAVKVFDHVPGGANMINTFKRLPSYGADTIKVVVKFKADAVNFSTFSMDHFNPYLIVNQIRDKEIHLANRIPTAKMDISYFGKGDDNSNSRNGKYFKTQNNLPWALNIINNIPYPQENIDFQKAYLHFSEWATSSGTNYKDWYLKKDGYRDDSKLFIQ